MTKPQVLLPHSWSTPHWPPIVWPNNPARARNLLREHRQELILAGVLSRVGRELIWLGGPYQRWLQSKATNVPNYEIEPNRRRLERERAAAPT